MYQLASFLERCLEKFLKMIQMVDLVEFYRFIETYTGLRAHEIVDTNTRTNSRYFG